MKVKDLIRDPKLIKVVLDDPEIIAAFGEPQEIYTWDLPEFEEVLEVFDEQGDLDKRALVSYCKSNMFDQDGKPLFTGKKRAPVILLKHALTPISKILGNSGSPVE